MTIADDLNMIGRDSGIDWRDTKEGRTSTTAIVKCQPRCGESTINSRLSPTDDPDQSRGPEETMKLDHLLLCLSTLHPPTFLLSTARDIRPRQDFLSSSTIVMSKLPEDAQLLTISVASSEGVKAPLPMDALPSRCPMSCRDAILERSSTIKTPNSNRTVTTRMSRKLALCFV